MKINTLLLLFIALLRRGTALKSKKDYRKAVVDFEKVLTMESNNKKAEVHLLVVISLKEIILRNVCRLNNKKEKTRKQQC